MSTVTIKKSGFPDIFIDFDYLKKHIKNWDINNGYVKFEEGLPKFTEDEFEENKKVLLNFVDIIEKDASKREELFDAFELTKAGKIKKNAYFHFINVAGFVPLAYGNEYGNIYYISLGLTEDYSRNCYKLDTGNKSCAATKLPWNKVKTTKKINSKDTIPMHYYKDSYGKEFLYIGKFEFWSNWNCSTGTLDSDFIKMNLKSDFFYFYILKSKLKKYENVEDFSIVFREICKKCNILEKPKAFIEDIGIEERPLADAVEVLKNEDMGIITKYVKV